MAADIVAFMSKNDIEKPTLIGHSMYVLWAIVDIKFLFAIL